MMGEATAMGAVSVVNALACGKGATVAVRLPTSARIEVNEHRGGWRVTMNGRQVKPALAMQTVMAAIRMIGRDPKEYSGSVVTKTSAPVGVGLKTSSSSSVAIALAVLSAFGEKPRRATDVLRCSASASLAAGVSVTGAMDDAASCLVGGANFVDNSSGRLLSAVRLGSPKPVLIRVPTGRSKRSNVRLSYVKRFSDLATSIFETAKQGHLWKAMTLNGLLYSTIYGYSPYTSLNALGAGALGSGLSGTGPAVAAVFDDRNQMESLASVWSNDAAALIRTETCDGGAVLGH